MLHALVLESIETDTSSFQIESESVTAHLIAMLNRLQPRKPPRLPLFHMTQHVANLHRASFCIQKVHTNSFSQEKQHNSPNFHFKSDSVRDNLVVF